MQEDKILVLGGSAFLGKTFLDVLGQSNKPYRVFCLNKGTIYWNDQSMRDHPNVTHISCNRDDCDEFVRIILSLEEKLGICEFQKWKAVVDYSAYYERHVESVVKALKNNAEKYILISTDAVYNNSLVRVKPPVKQDQFNMEWQLKLLPQEPNITDLYGYNKLKIQILMRKICKMPYVCLRFPDVLGPYDQFRGEQRLWCTIFWLFNSQQYPIFINRTMREKKISFVSSIDAANLVLSLIERKQFPSQAYNFAFEQSLTLFQFYEKLAQLFNIKPKYVQINNENVKHLFPASDEGTLSWQKAHKQLGWTPSKLQQCLQKVVQFYKDAKKKYPKQKQLMKNEFKSKILDKFYPASK